MINKFPDLRFEAAVDALVSKRNIMFGSGASSFHVQVPDERDTGSIFSNAQSEAKFYALVGYVKQRGTTGAADLFSGVAHEFISTFEYSMEVAHWLAYVNALLVGVPVMLKMHGRVPINQTIFVMEWLSDECATVADETNTEILQKEIA